MQVILIHQKSDEPPPLITGYEFETSYLDEGAFGSTEPVWMERLRCQTGSSGVHGTIVFVHATDTAEWGHGKLAVDDIRGEFERSPGGLVALIPFTTQHGRYPARSGGVLRYGSRDLERLLKSVLSGARFASEEEVVAFLDSEPVAEAQEVAQALSILCQGYLAVHASDELGDINEALEKMGWFNFLKESSSTLDLEKMQGKRQEVRDGDWWKVVFPERPPEASLGPAGDTVPVRTLLSQIYGDGEVEPGDVARAYLELAKAT